ncbi:MAG: sugar transferase [Candidatus Schekmanbacteria bacterium]|nr:sugar transferase [Candidatus Schekmanbacteria bacterium]
MNNSTIRKLFVFDKLILDCLAITISFIIAYITRYIIQIPFVFQSIDNYYDDFTVGIIAWIFFLIKADLYRHKAQLCKFDEFFSIVGAGIFATLCMFAYMSLIKESTYARLTFIYSGALGIILIPIMRSALHSAHNRMRREGFGIIHTLIVGGGKSGEMLENKIRNHPEIGYRLVGTIKEEQVTNNPDASSSGADKYPEMIKKLFNATFDFVNKNHVDEIIYIRSRSHREDMMKIVYFCQDKNITLTLVPDLFEIMTKKIDYADLGNIPLIRLKQSPIPAWQNAIKRIIDFILSLAGLIILSPLIGAIVLLIKLNSRGPAIFKQERIGKDGHPFIMYKFRSMKTYASNLPPTRAEEDDPRLTSIGKYLRKFSIDELPQLYNVLKGDMTMVGPRPETALYVDQYNSWQRRRLEMIPGITGLAQVNGVRGNIDSVDERVMYDIEYIENQNIWLDIKILFATLLVFPFQRKAG